MSVNELNTKIKELKELRRMAEELEAEIEAIQNSIKEEMSAQNTDILTGIDWKVTWKSVESSRFDTTTFKKENAALYNQYLKKTSSKRFLLA